MIITGKKFSKPEMSRVINGDVSLGEEPEKVEKIRLDVMMAEIYKSYNRSTLQKFIEYGFVSVDGKMIKKSNTKFPRGVKIDLKIPKVMKNADLVPKVIYEDGNVVVLDKPNGLLSMKRGEYCPENTLEEYGLLVHRLDRDTSGVVILAKNEEVQAFLKKQFQDREAHKTYYAVIEGRPKLDEAVINVPLARDLKRPTTFRVDPNGKPAETYYKVEKTNNEVSLVVVKPVTGRTHQIRVHMKYLGHPVVGDVVYGNNRGKAAKSDAPTLSRLYLHATELTITLPGGAKKTFKSRLPREFLEFFE